MRIFADPGFTRMPPPGGVKKIAREEGVTGNFSVSRQGRDLFPAGILKHFTGLDPFPFHGPTRGLHVCRRHESPCQNDPVPP